MRDASWSAFSGADISLESSCEILRKTDGRSFVFLAGGGIDCRIFGGEDLSDSVLPVISNRLKELTSRDLLAVLAALSACPSSLRSCSSFCSATGESTLRNVLLNGFPMP